MNETLHELIFFVTILIPIIKISRTHACRLIKLDQYINQKTTIKYPLIKEFMKNVLMSQIMMKLKTTNRTRGWYLHLSW